MGSLEVGCDAWVYSLAASHPPILNDKFAIIKNKKGNWDHIQNYLTFLLNCHINKWQSPIQFVIDLEIISNILIFKNIFKIYYIFSIKNYDILKEVLIA